MSALKEVLFGEIRRVSHVWRYSAVPVVNRENVAEHSWWTAVIAMTIAAEIGREDLMPEVAMRGILHDMEEIGTGDLVREAKYFDKEMREDFRRVEEAFAERLFNKLEGPSGKLMFEKWKVAKHPDDAGMIVALADLLCVISYCRHEASLGNKNVVRIEHECQALIKRKFADTPLWEIAGEAIS